eukprot:762703-Hanusia_phi.AAC.3
MHAKSAPPPCRESSRCLRCGEDCSRDDSACWYGDGSLFPLSLGEVVTGSDDYSEGEVGLELSDACSQKVWSAESCYSLSSP